MRNLPKFPRPFRNARSRSRPTPGIASVGARVMNLKEKFPEAIGTRSIRSAHLYYDCKVHCANSVATLMAFLARQTVDAPSCLGFVRGTMNVIVIAKTVPPQLFWCGRAIPPLGVSGVFQAWPSCNRRSVTNNLGCASAQSCPAAMRCVFWVRLVCPPPNLAFPP